MEIKTDEKGYIYIEESSGAKRYILVEVPGCFCLGKLRFGEQWDYDPPKENEDG